MIKPKQELVSAHTPMQPAQPCNDAPTFSFEQMQRMATSIAKSGLFGVKEADQALALMFISHAEGKHPALVARDYSIIQGRPAKNSEAILRDFQASGGRVEWHQRDDKAAIATFTHPLAVKPMKIEWDIARAEKAGLGGKDMYKRFPRQMLSARCISEGCRATAPQATGGFYTPEEVQQFVDDEPAPMSITAAVEHAAALALTEDERQAYINAMDVPTLPQLESAFAAAWKATKDPKIRAQFKEIYDGMRAEIERPKDEVAQP